jgi:hypothetical protein
MLIDSRSAAEPVSIKTVIIARLDRLTPTVFRSSTRARLADLGSLSAAIGAVEALYDSGGASIQIRSDVRSAVALTVPVERRILDAGRLAPGRPVQLAQPIGLR